MAVITCVRPSVGVHVLSTTGVVNAGLVRFVEILINAGCANSVSTSINFTSVAEEINWADLTGSRSFVGIETSRAGSQAHLQKQELFRGVLLTRSTILSVPSIAGVTGIVANLAKSVDWIFIEPLTATRNATRSTEKLILTIRTQLTLIAVQN